MLRWKKFLAIGIFVVVYIENVLFANVSITDNIHISGVISDLCDKSEACACLYDVFF